MALSIKKPEVDELVREVCSLTGESLTSAIEISLRERLDRLQLEREEEVRRRVEEFKRYMEPIWAELEKHRLVPPDPEGAMAAMDKILWDEDGLPA